MPTDLRAALRDLLTTRDEDEQERLARLEAAIAALADAPLTVAELLTSPEFLAGTHDIASDLRPKSTLRCVDDVVCWRVGGSVYWKAAALGVDLLTSPARLVEVTP